MAKITLDTALTDYGATKLNANFQKIADEFNAKVLYRENPVGEPNSMNTTDLDMNGNRIYNLPEPVLASEAARLQDVQNAISGATQANLITFIPSGTISATNVQGAIQELDGETQASLATKTNTADLADANSLSKGDALVAVKQPFTGSVVRTQHSKNTDVINARDFGVVGDGVADDAPALQAAINYLQSIEGGTLKIPAGTYKLVSGLVISRGGITLEGDGWEEYIGAFAANIPQLRGKGTWLYWTDTNIVPITLAANGANGVIIRDIAFDQAKTPVGPGWSPILYQPAIKSLSGPCLLDNLYFFGVDKGIEVGAVGAATGRTHLNRIFGEFFSFGVRIFFAADVVRITNYHQYPFWSAFTANIATYTQANTNGIMSYRNDNPHYSNIFIGGVFRGFYFGNTADGATNKFVITNADVDFSNTGFIFDGNGISGSIANSGSQPGINAALPSSRVFFVVGNNNNIYCTNFRGGHTNAEVIRVSGVNNRISFTNLEAVNWDENNTGTVFGISSADPSNFIWLSGSVVTVNTASTSAFLGGSASSFRWNQAAKGTINTATNGSGDIVVNHGLGFPPNAIQTQLQSGFQFILTINTVTATTFTVRVLNASTGAPAVAANVLAYWTASM